LIKKYNINAGNIKPSGKNGRILKEDVLAYINNAGGKSMESVEVKKPEHIEKPKIESTRSETVKQEVCKSKPVSPQQPVTPSQNDQVIKLTGFKKAMVKTMTQSSIIPSFLFTDEYNVDKLVKLRKELNKLDSKFKITYMPFLIKAVSLALDQYPLLNSHTNPETDAEGYITEFIIKKDHNISIAIDSPDGLVVPNIKKVQDKTIVQIQKELNLLRDKAESRKLTHDDLKDGTFTISNIGNIGGKVLSPVILPPQTCIIGVSRFFDSLTVMDKDSEVSESQAYHLLENKNLLVVFHKTVNICVSADHRVIDGASVARFSSVFKNYIENPLKIWTAN
jgi:2-oxoisovalerate dehydrogenase E2 component (dihydrolipoyl transacylase)